MKPVANCSIDCIKQLLPNIAASGLWAAGTAALAIPASAVAIPAIVGLACVGTYIGLIRVADSNNEEKERRDLASAMDVIRARATNVETELSALGYQLQFSIEDIHRRLSSLDTAMTNLSEKLENLGDYLHNHSDQFDALCLFLQVNFNELKPFITSLPSTLEELRGDVAAVTRSLIRIEDNQANQATKADLQQMQKHIIDSLLASQPSNLPPDPFMQRDLVSAIERITRDAEYGELTACNILTNNKPKDAATYLSSQRAKLDQAQYAFNAQINSEKLKLDREIAAISYFTGKIEIAEAAVRRIIAVSPDDAFAINYLGWIYQLRGDNKLAEAQYDRIIIIASTGSTINEDMRSAALGNLASLHQTRGDLIGAEKLYAEALAVKRKLGNLEAVAAILGNLGSIAHTRNELDKAKSLYQKSLEIEIKLKHPEGQASDYGNLGNIEHEQGNYAAAINLYKKSLAIHQSTGNLEGQANQLGNLGLASISCKEYITASKLLTDSLVINCQLGRLEGQAIQLGNLGRIAFIQNDFKKAEDFFNEALNINRKIERLEGVANQLCNLANVAIKQKNFSKARNLFTSSRDLFAKIGAKKHLKSIQDQLIKLSDL